MVGCPADRSARLTPAEFIAKWRPSGGAENANSQPFIGELCDLLDVPRPNPTQASDAANDYVFEKTVRHVERGVESSNRIDLYKRDAFILESKQSSSSAARRGIAGQGELLPEHVAPVKGGMALRGTAAWERAMRRAYTQARAYVLDLPAHHNAPPFLVVVDVGYVIELYADFSGRGRNYTQFPGRTEFSIPLERLADDAVRERLRRVWTEPKSLDPAIRSAEVTRDVAERLGRVAAELETTHDPADVATFLMRCLFTMFAEDVGLIPAMSFTTLLSELREAPQRFVPELEALWATMDTGGYAPALKSAVKRFNGSLFKDRTALPLDRGTINELCVAANREWTDVEPAIFGTMLEKALTAKERSQLGAHYTPRAYVERLVVPTIIEPLRADWDLAKAAIEDAQAKGDQDAALAAARAFHHTLCTTRVLDPACGTGNFLYVALELMKRLEGEVLTTIAALTPQGRLEMTGETVDPSQFFGLELNPRAVAIADLVLWLGFLKWQLQNVPAARIPEPVLHAYGTIREADAVLAYDARRPRLGDDGEPLTRWDGETMKVSPVTGRLVPDEFSRVPVYAYVNPRRAAWPEAEFIVGNPPFVGGKDLRDRLGDGYAEALWKARPEVPGGADFVMQWWDEAARRLVGGGENGRTNPLRRFGFITTNSITQTFSRRVVGRHLSGKVPVSLVFAVADHPWVKGADRAAVRIAMTVATLGHQDGALGRIVREAALNTDAPVVELALATGTVTAKLTLGADLNAAVPLLSNEGLSSRGVSLHGAGFIVTPETARALGLGRIAELEKHIREYRNGRDLAQRPRGVMVIDLFGLTADEVRERFPTVYQHVAEEVRPHREAGRGRSLDATEYADNWWLFGKVRTEMRAYTAGLVHYVVTIETTKHRIFQFASTATLPDNMLVTIGIARAEKLAILSSRLHATWAIASGGWLGVGNDSRYSKTRTFDPFPFPALLTDADPDPHARALKDRLGELGERLDAFRKERLAAEGDLTMTGLYNRLERRREALAGGAPLTDVERENHARAQTTILAELHDDIDRATLAAYGWDDLAPALIGKPGGTTPSTHKDERQEAAEEAMLSRLVALNAERAREEAQGFVRWLRPDYQVPKLGHKVKRPAAEQIEADIAPASAAVDARPWPDDARDQFAAVRAILDAAPDPLPQDAIARAFKGSETRKGAVAKQRRERVAEVLAILSDLGLVRSGQRGAETLYFTRR